MEIIVILGNGKIVTIEVFKTEKIKDLKKKCQEKTGSNLVNSKFEFNNKILDDDDKSIDEYKIDSKSIITVINKNFQLSVVTIDGITLTVDVHNSTKIIDIKQSIQRKFGINIDEQLLIYRATILNDDKTLDQYEINRESIILILNTSKVLIFVELPNSETLAIHANSNDKIIDIKYLINNKTGLEINGLMLSYENKILENNKTINQYQIHDKSVIRACNNDKIRIFITTMSGEKQEFIILTTDKVIEVKRKIQQKIQLAPDEQKLIFQGTILRDEKSVSEYRIIDKSVVNVVARLRSGMQIFFKTIDGKRFSIEVEKSDKIIDIKYKIQDKIGLHRDEQRLIYQDGILDDDNKSIDEYQICDQSVINIVRKSRGDRMKIFVKTNNKEMIGLEVEKSDKIIDIKYQIQERIGLHREDQILIYHGKKLQNNYDTIDEYKIIENSIINLFALSLMKHQ